jgi:hypothetical protein
MAVGSCTGEDTIAEGRRGLATAIGPPERRRVLLRREVGGLEGVRRVVLVLRLVLMLVAGRGRLEGSVDEGREKWPARLDRRLLGFEAAPP